MPEINPPPAEQLAPHPPLPPSVEGQGVVEGVLPIPKTSEREREFLEQSYWRLGCIILAWATVTMVCVLRRRMLEIPVFGSVQPVEAIIFTQSAFCFLLPLHLAIIAIFRGAAMRYDWRSRFPGVLSSRMWQMFRRLSIRCESWFSLRS